MATKSAQQEPEKAEVIEEALDAVDTTLDRVKVLYEQYFLGIQKQPPTYLHTDVERKLRDIAQLQIRNTALRYRFATLQQKFGSYNSYWRRTLRQIENGTYTRNLFKIGREAARTGAAVPPEILAAMPKRMREQVIRDREAALALARLREKPPDDFDLLTLADEDVEVDLGDLDPEAAAYIEESVDVRRDALTAGGAYKIDETDADFDLDAFFKSVTREGELSQPLPTFADRSGRSSELPVVGRASTRSEPRPPPEGQPGHPRPATLSGSLIQGFTEEIRLPGGQQTRSRTGRGSSSGRTQAPSDGSRRPGASGKTSGPIELGRAGPAPPGSPPGHPPAGPVSGSQIPAGLAKLMTPSKHTPPQAVPRVSKPAAPHGRVAEPPTPPPIPSQATRSIPVVPGASAPSSAASSAPSQATRSIPVVPGKAAPSQVTRSIPVVPGAAAARTAEPVETLAGPFPRIPGIPGLPGNLRGGKPTGAAASSAGAASGSDRSAVPGTVPRAVPQAVPEIHDIDDARERTEPTDVPDETTDVMPAASADRTPARERAPAPPHRAAPVPQRPTPPVRPTPPPRERREPDPPQAPPPGMTDADVNALYAKYVNAKQMLGEETGPGAYSKLLKTINAQAPKIMEQYNAKGVDFSVVVKDNQVIIRAKPKT